MAGLARLTLRCLREDLALTVRAPTRIAAIDDEVLFKVKAQRWRGAIWLDAGIPSLVAAGLREEGSPDDFYASLAARGKAARARYNAEHSPALVSTTYTADLLPGRGDDLRWRAETSNTDRTSAQGSSARSGPPVAA